MSNWTQSASRARRPFGTSATACYARLSVIFPSAIANRSMYLRDGRALQKTKLNTKSTALSILGSQKSKCRAGREHELAHGVQTQRQRNQRRPGSDPEVQALNREVRPRQQIGRLQRQFDEMPSLAAEQQEQRSERHTHGVERREREKEKPE